MRLSPSLQVELIFAAVVTAIILVVVNRSDVRLSNRIGTNVVLGASVFLASMLFVGGPFANWMTHTFDPILPPILQWGFIFLVVAAAVGGIRARGRRRKRVVKH
jgi:hypothetical protein